MSILCKIFGHQPPVYSEGGWYSPGNEYGKLVQAGTDGTGRKHGAVYCECARCQKEFLVARIHLPEEQS